MYYREHFNTGYIATIRAATIYAKDATTNYIVASYKTTFERVIIYKIHFDPDSSSCGTKAYKTPLKATTYNTLFDWKTKFVVYSAYFDTNLKAIMMTGWINMIPGYQKTNVVSRQGIVTGILLSEIDKEAFQEIPVIAPKTSLEPYTGALLGAKSEVALVNDVSIGN